MNLKTKMKNFFTLTRKANGGFTLVELIVVIAILAILGGVAVPAYSGYVKKANMQADRTLISDIENALTLAYYAGDLTEGSAGFLLLDPTGENTMDSANNNPNDYDNGGPVALALEKTFGSNWMDSMQLKYDEWGVSWTTMSYEDAKNYVDSNFVQKYSANELMAHVQAMTDAVNGLQLQIGDTEVKLKDMYNYEDENGTQKNAIDEVIAEYGINKTWDELSSTEKSNLLVLATAASISKGYESGVTTVMPQYALYTAFAAEDPEFNEAYKTFQETINSIDPNSADSQYSQIKSAYNTLKIAATDNGYKDWAGDSNDSNSNAAKNAAAFETIMSGVGNAMSDNGDEIRADLGNANMFTSGIGYDMYNDYLSSALATANNVADFDEVLEALLEMGLFPGAVLVQYAVVNGVIHITSSLPVT